MIAERSGGPPPGPGVSSHQLGEEKETIAQTVRRDRPQSHQRGADRTFVPAMNVLAMRSVRSIEHLQKGSTGRRQRNSEQLEPHGFVGLAFFYDSGARSIYNSVRPCTDRRHEGPEDSREAIRIESDMIRHSAAAVALPTDKSLPDLPPG